MKKKKPSQQKPARFVAYRRIDIEKRLSSDEPLLDLDDARRTECGVPCLVISVLNRPPVSCSGSAVHCCTLPAMEL